MSDRLAAVDAALTAALTADRFLEEAAVESCQQGLVDFYVDEIAALTALQTSLRRLV
jgi:hypothetical protein